MPRLKTIINPKSYFNIIWKIIKEKILCLNPNWRGIVCHPPGHFFSPLLDIENFGPNDKNLSFDGADWWEHINLRPGEQLSYYEDLMDRFPLPSLPNQKTDGYRYYTGNPSFPISDAFTLSGIIQKEKPRRIVEVGAGFSSAVILDTLQHARLSADLTFIEPYPDLLHSLLRPEDRSISTILSNRVQEVSLSVFDQLEAHDLVFIDSSHVAKVGSDVSFILLRILPRLKPGILVHFHDVYYPFSYPASWIRQGRAWNESLFLRAFLVCNPQFELVAFNSYIGNLFPEIFRERFPAFMHNTGGSLWIRKVA